MALKILKPTMRDKKRYLLLSGSFSRKDVENTIIRYIGVLGYSKANPMWVRGKILAVNRKEVEKVKASFALSDSISVKKVSGTLKGLGK